MVHSDLLELVIQQIGQGKRDVDCAVQVVEVQGLLTNQLVRSAKSSI